MASDAEEKCVADMKRRVAAYGFADHEINHATLRRRFLIATGVIFSIVLFAEIAAAVVGRANSDATITRLVYASIELPALIYCLSMASDRALRRRFGPIATLALSSLVSAGVGAVAMTCMYSIGKVWPLAGQTFMRASSVNLSYVQMVVLGMVIAQIHQGIWALAYVYPFAAHDARLRALEAEKLRSTAELARLKSHLEPHFLLNTLNAIAGLVTEDPREARRLLACLGDLLRDGLREGDEMITLSEEESWLRRYTEILESRHRGMLEFRWEIAAEVQAVEIPRLMLQPLVENAVKHGALRRRGGGCVTVRAFVTPKVNGSQTPCGSVTCIIDDNGPGFVEGPLRQGALGLKMVRRRLELKFRHASFRIESSSDGTSAVIEFAAPRPTSHFAVRALTGETALETVKTASA